MPKVLSFAHIAPVNIVLNVHSFAFTIVRTVWQNRSIPMGWSVSTQSTSRPLSWLIWLWLLVLSFQFLQIILAFTSRLFVCVVFVFIRFFGSAADISNRWRCSDICARRIWLVNLNLPPRRNYFSCSKMELGSLPGSQKLKKLYVCVT